MRSAATSFAFVLAAAGFMLAAAGPLSAADHGAGGMRQQPLEPSAGRWNDGPAAGIAGASGQRRPPPESRTPPPVSIDDGGTHYLVSGGRWYEQRGDDLVPVTPPAGVLVRDLPKGYALRWVGGVPYFFADGLFYVWRERQQRYEILQYPPTGDPAGSNRDQHAGAVGKSAARP